MSKYKTLDDLPLSLSAMDVAEVLGLSRAGAYNLLDKQGFPTLKVGKRKIVPCDKFLDWMEQHTEEIG